MGLCLMTNVRFMVGQTVQGRKIDLKGNLSMCTFQFQTFDCSREEIREDLIFKFYYRSLAEGQDKGHRGAGAMCVKGVCPGTHFESPLPCWIGSQPHPTLQNFALPAGAAPLSFADRATCIVFYLQASSTDSWALSSREFHTEFIIGEIYLVASNSKIDSGE